ncbi:MAG TPA: tyrosine-type recombinase/integrase [Ferruginibacter sp.]|nr:tyrosine-type recombinase/integrase [Ferruginibacter sp.]HRN79178.1 tyrosine-type recombinase/integrase [Ferruginibacter sp.]HRO16828.1 tyrosine-type recombinase/integrase [Ferruginibacter sp.]HRQ20200.1 tyrosine-type recombinase/integrase [Ferruginibacter sp.]
MMQEYEINFQKNSVITRAIHQIPGFLKILEQLKKQMINNGTSASTFKNYLRYVSVIALHYNKRPDTLTREEIDDYLYMLKQRSTTPSLSYFKFTVYGLSYMFRALRIKRKLAKLPSIKHETRLPVVLSFNEMMQLLSVRMIEKHRILISLLYECGMRCKEVRMLEVRDLDFDRKTILIRNGKGNRERIVPMGKSLKNQLRKYIQKNKPVQWLFNIRGSKKITLDRGGDFDRGYSQKGVQWAVQQAVKRAGITKRVSVHTLRHTYATHLLESGVNIVQIQKWLGHVNIQATLIYLHVSDYGKYEKLSLLDHLNKKMKHLKSA